MGKIAQRSVVPLFIVDLERGFREPARGAHLIGRIRIEFEIRRAVGHIDLQHQGHTVDAVEVLYEPGAAVQSFFFAAEAGEHDRGLEIAHPEHTRQFHYASGTGAVIVRARDLGRGGIDMPADHDDTVGRAAEDTHRDPAGGVHPIGRGHRHDIRGVTTCGSEGTLCEGKGALFSGGTHRPGPDLPRKPLEHSIARAIRRTARRLQVPGGQRSG